MKTTSTANAAKRDAAVSTWPAPSTRLIKILMPIPLIAIAKTIFVIQSPLCFKAIAPFYLKVLKVRSSFCKLAPIKGSSNVIAVAM